MERRKRKKSADESFSIDEETMNEILQKDAEDDLVSSKKPGFRSAYRSRLVNKKISQPKGVVSKRSTKRISVPQIEEDLNVEELDSKKAEEIYLKIKKWRQKNQAVVDTQGAEQHYVETDPKNEQAFQVMVGVLLSVQSNDVVTDRVMKTLLKDGVSIKKYAELTPKQVQEKIMGINFNQKKSIYIQEAAQKITDDFKGTVPSTLKELTSFKGIGPKVAHLIL